ncbi:hypothetical protein Tco_1383192 [Tanacetum coccineum]
MGTTRGIIDERNRRSNQSRSETTCDYSELSQDGEGKCIMQNSRGKQKHHTFKVYKRYLFSSLIITHDAKEIRDKVKMLLEGSERTKAEVIVQKVLGRTETGGQGNSARGSGHIARNYTQPKHPTELSNTSKDKMLLMKAQENGGNLGWKSNPVYDEAGPSYDSNILSEVQAHDHYQDAYMTSYDQYVKDNAVPVVQNNASMVPNDAYVMIDNDLHDSDVRSVSHTPKNTVTNNLLNAKLATYKEQVELYERRARTPDPIKSVDEYPPNTPETLVPRVLSNQTELDQSTVDRKHDAIERKNLLLEHDNIIADCLLKEVFYVASNSELNVEGKAVALMLGGSQHRCILKEHRIRSKSDSLKKVERPL